MSVAGTGDVSATWVVRSSIRHGLLGGVGVSAVAAAPAPTAVLCSGLARGAHTIACRPCRWYNGGPCLLLTLLRWRRAGVLALVVLTC